MSSKILKNAVKAALLSSVVLASSHAMAADKQLLDMLKANGAISQEQYDELMAKPDATEETLKKMAWAGKVKVKGDLRLRQEFISETGDDGEDRQRIRARVGVYAKVNDQVDAGVRIVTGSSDDATSTNQTLGNDDFSKHDAWFDLAYLNWHPIQGLELIGGKFKKPWEEVSGGLVWDGDVNPEGGAVRYTFDLGGGQLIASAGHLVLDDIDGFSFDEDEKVVFGQLASKFKAGGAKVLVGASVYDWEPNDGAAVVAPIGAGQNSTDYSIQELFGEVGFDAGIPLKVYGHYARNADADGPNDGEDTAWLLGVGTKLGSWKFSYDYRETELNAVQGAFNDSDFAGGLTDSEGHKFKVGYMIDKNFSIESAYLDTETNDLNGNLDIETWQIDLKAKF